MRADLYFNLRDTWGAWSLLLHAKAKVICSFLMYRDPILHMFSLYNLALLRPCLDVRERDPVSHCSELGKALLTLSYI